MTKKQMYGWLVIVSVLAVIVEFIISGTMLLKSQAGCSSLCGDSLDAMITIGWMFGITFMVITVSFIFIALNKSK